MPQRGLLQLPSCSQAEETAQRAAQVTEDARTWHVPAKVPEAQRSFDCREEHRGAGVGGEQKEVNFWQQDFIVYLVLSLPKCLQRLQNAQAPDSSKSWQGKAVPDLQRGAERFA